MFDSVIAWFTPERRARIAFPSEIGLGIVLAFVALLNSTAYGVAYFAFAAIVTGVLSAGVVLHRVVPGAALGTLAIAPIVYVGTTSFGSQVPGTWYLSGAIILFGSAAWGSPAVRGLGLAVSIALALTLAFWVFIGGASVYPGAFEMFSYFASPILAWLIGELVRSIRNRRALSATVATVSTQRDAALTRADLEAERTRVARDVHDIVAHSLTVVIAQADGARYATAGDSPAAADAFETIAQTARDALGEVRVLLTELRHTQEAGPQPGVGDIDSLLAAMRDSGLALKFTEFGARGGLTDTRALALYRILQEALTNALRHGDGSGTVELEWGTTAVDLTVTNRPSDVAQASTDSPSAENHGGHGIDGMRERAALAGGELVIHSGDPFRVRARLPLSAADDDTTLTLPAQTRPAETRGTTEVLS